MMNDRAAGMFYCGLLIVLTGSSSGSAQEPIRQETKPRVGTASAVPAQDTKALKDAETAAAAAAVLEGAYQGERSPEAVRMLALILRGTRMGPGEGWWGPSLSRYSWNWLAERCGIDPKKGAIPRSHFQGSQIWFKCLDRSKDDVIAPDDLDWSEQNPYVQTTQMATRIFRKLNTHGDGQLTKEELLHLFEKGAQRKEYLTLDDFRDAFFSGLSSGPGPGEAPSRSTMIRRFFSGEMGSLNEGPNLNEPAPDFTLRTADGKQSLQLSKLVKSMPVVLVFGSFT